MVENKTAQERAEQWAFRLYVPIQAEIASGEPQPATKQPSYMQVLSALKHIYTEGRREGLEEACRLVCPACAGGDIPANYSGIRTVFLHDYTDTITGLVSCPASPIRARLAEEE